ncbi:hypothetical protein Tco_0890023, partial [Tanacetum coccineum]
MSSDSASSEVTYASISLHGDPLAWAVDFFRIQEPESPDAAPASPDYVPGHEEPEQAPLSPDYVPGPEYPEYLAPFDEEVPVEDQPYVVADSPIALSPGYVADSDPEEDYEDGSVDYPADGGDGDDDLRESSFQNILPRKFLRSGSHSNVGYEKSCQSSKFGLSKRKFVIVCHEKVVRIPLEGDDILRVHGERTQGVMKTLMNIKLRIDLVHGATPAAKSPYRLASLEMQELSEQFQSCKFEDGLSVIATKVGTPLMLDSCTSDMCIQSCGRSSYTRALIEVRADVELKDNIVVVMPKIIREGDECSKNKVSNMVENIKKPSQTHRSVMDKILATLSETSKVENTPAEMLCDLDQQMEKRADDGKANVVTDALSRKERVKPRRVRAMAMTIQYRVRGMILAAQIQETTDKVVLIKEKLKAARDHQKSYADNKRKPLEFEVGDRVMLKVSPWKGVIRFGKKGKLAPRYVGPFEILKRIGPIAYRLRLPEELSGVHDMFLVSNLKKCLADASLHVQLDEIK